MKNAEQFIKTIEEKAREWDVSAVLSVRDREGFQYEGAFGFADREAGRPMTVGERFCLDVETGFFLTLCVMDLAERKMLKLSDRVSRFIPEYRHAERITVRNLLRWRSAMPDYWSESELVELQTDPAHAALSDRERFRRECEVYARDRSFQEILDRIGGLDLLREPGREEDGSSSTLPFLGEIVRRVSGLSARDYLFERFFRPLGMTETRPGNDATAALYGVFRDKELVRLPSFTTAGSFTTTLRDMDRLARALAEKRVFSEGTWRTMLTCLQEMGMGFIRRGELYRADLYLHKLRETFWLGLCFEDGTSILMLMSEAPMEKRDEHHHWRTFPSDVCRLWQDSRVYPEKPELRRVNGKNIWDVLDIEILPEQLDFIPECSRCVAAMLAMKQPVYVLMDHGMPIGMAALTVKPKQKEFLVAFLMVDHRYQHRGYGRILLTKAVEILKEAGAKELEIGVNRFNEPAHRLYRSVGFEDRGVYDQFIDMKMTLTNETDKQLT